VSEAYDPVLAFCFSQLRNSSSRPVVIGVQAPQGAGKTTLVQRLLKELPAQGVRAAGVSIDDFYLPRAAQLAVAAANPGNRYLEHRGYPGTHDVDLGEETLRQLRQSTGEILVPVYDKSAHGGRGDRTPQSEWRAVRGPIDIAFVEGWMLGYTPVAERTIADPHLVPTNRALAEYDRWHRLIDAWVVLRAVDPSFVLTWRVDAEEKMKAAGKPGLSREDIEDYIRRFLPAYATWGGAPPNVPKDQALELKIELSRKLAD
jgi:D-glycerate 3-kinase